MNEKNIELFSKLDDFRGTFEEDNIYCYQMLLIFIKEIFMAENGEEIFLSLQDNLMTTIRNLLTYLKARKNYEKEEYSIFDVNDINTYVYLICEIYSVLDLSDNYSLQDQDLIDQVDNALNLINQNSNMAQYQYENLKSKALADENANICCPEFIEVNNNINKIIQELEEQEQDQKQNNIGYFSYEENIHRESLKEYLIRKKLLSYECDICGLQEWQNNPLPLKLDFIDKNKDNLKLNNLRFLCPNCFSLYGYND